LLRRKKAITFAAAFRVMKRGEREERETESGPRQKRLGNEG